MLRRFDANGKPIWSGGRLGEGPGEYRSPIRAAITPTGIAVADMLARRITLLDAAGKYATSVAVNGLLGAAAVRPGTNDVVIVSDDFRGSHPILRWKKGDAEPVKVATQVDSGVTGEFRFKITIPSAAIAPNGTIAYFTDADVYQIHRIDERGNRLAPLTRDVARVKRTAEEKAAMRSGGSSVGTRGSAPAGAKPKATYSAPPPKPGEEDLKGHFGANALRYDPSGRLWVRTARGDMTKTIFDIFAASGAFVGSITVPEQVRMFAVSATTLATVAENEDGLPAVTLWTIKR